MKNDIIGIILDWAGTSIDFGSQAPVVSFIEAFQNFGILISADEVREFMGLEKKEHTMRLLNTSRIKEVWKEKYSNYPEAEDVESVYENLQLVMSQVLEEYCDPIPGCLELVEKMKYQDVKIGSTTGYVKSMMKNIVPIAAEKGFKPDSVVCPDDVIAGRPFPWMCYQNSINLKIYPFNKMVKIGDTPADIQEGLNAGMWTVGLTLSGNEVGLSQTQLNAMDEMEVKEKRNSAERNLLNYGAHYVTDGLWSVLPILEEINEKIKSGIKP